MRNRDVIFVIVAVLVLSCLTIAGPGDADKKKDLYADYETFSRLVNTVRANYVEEVDAKKLFYGAYEGMLRTLDPHSAFLPPEEREDLEIHTKGEFGGLGIEITLDKSGVLTVSAPLEDSPAFKAGVLAGDRIIRIEGKSTKGLSLSDAVKQLRGPKGTAVTITVLHETGKVEDIRIVRDIIKLQSIKNPHFVDEKSKIGYIRITQFQENTAESMDATVKDLLDKGMKALIIDLRFNPGGLLKAAIEVADRFLSDGVIVSTKGRRSREEVYEAKKNNTYPDFPLVLLISGRSASASEILAGAIKDRKRGILVGMRTFGKGSVQTLLKLDDGEAAIRLTTAYYYTPSGRLIHHNQNDPKQETWGIDPDIEVKVSPQDEADLWSYWRDEHMRRARERNPKAPENSEPKPEVKKDDVKKPVPPPIDPDDMDITPEVLKENGAEPKQPKEFRDVTLEAAVNAVKGMLISREQAAAAKAPAK